MRNPTHYKGVYVDFGSPNPSGIVLDEEYILGEKPTWREDVKKTLLSKRKRSDGKAIGSPNAPLRVRSVSFLLWWKYSWTLKYIAKYWGLRYDTVEKWKFNDKWDKVSEFMADASEEEIAKDGELFEIAKHLTAERTFGIIARGMKLSDENGIVPVEHRDLMDSLQKSTEEHTRWKLKKVGKLRGRQDKIESERLQDKIKDNEMILNADLKNIDAIDKIAERGAASVVGSNLAQQTVDYVNWDPLKAARAVNAEAIEDKAETKELPPPPPPSALKGEELP